MKPENLRNLYLRMMALINNHKYYAKEYSSYVETEFRYWVKSQVIRKLVPTRSTHTYVRISQSRYINGFFFSSIRIFFRSFVDSFANIVNLSYTHKDTYEYSFECTCSRSILLCVQKYLHLRRTDYRGNNFNHL